ncbi:hypothetical protein Q7C36_008164 [Tachysurus vachellii]|uniref:Uncharacterized protein n=1 Tax=Tachysurus vachellii TaxID=175792 RepID=A0AA88N6R0_TACVA|nr:hypothetical protein Q7C36_008164 [Tachysurus vachellii]
MENRAETWGSILSNVLSHHLALFRAGKKVEISALLHELPVKYITEHVMWEKDNAGAMGRLTPTINSP